MCANPCKHDQCKSFHTTKTSPPQVDSVTPAIDTHTGRRVEVSNECIKQESPYDSFYLMQLIKLGGSTALIFYDKGSNCHLIDGALAEKENLQVVTDQPTSIRVAGSNTVVTEYGKYRFRIGPTREGIYHTITCQGICSVTSEFSRYPMADIIKECRTIPGLENEIFPPYVGGGAVKLLIGIGDPALEPERIFTLPTGLAVYRAAIKDIYGSYLCIGGPHPSFSNSKLGEANMVSTMLVREVDQFRQSIYGNSNIRLSYQGSERISPEIVYDIPVKGMHLRIHPTPLNKEDFRDLGCSIEENNPCGVMQCGVYKAKVPISRLRELTEDKEVDDFPLYRCVKCSDCQECKTSSKTRSLTIKEAAEQQLIEGSVEHCVESKRMLASLPFIKDPVQFLTEKHGGKDNYRQALRVYVSQCKKSEKVKEGMRKVHKELVQRGFMNKLDDIPVEKRRRILDSPFLHYYPWRTVEKLDSISTPVRMVVDPTMSHLNLVLAKGTNSVANLLDILIRNRTAPYAWSSDISKLYNMLHLTDQALPYSLFLYHDALDSLTPPQVWVMLRAWYGVSATSGQAGHAIDMLVTKYGDEYPEAAEPLDKCRYVDDITPGSSTAEIREEQIKQCQELLDKGGFSLKFVVKSGEPPCEKASVDGSSMKLLGYKWIPQEDTLSPGLGELNFNKKHRGSKKPNVEPVVTEQDARKLVQDLIVTRRIVVSKIAEMFDPVGLFEPIKLQLKLAMRPLVDLDWEDPLPLEDQQYWKERFVEYIDYTTMQAKRSVINLEDGEKPIRLIGFSDAAEHAGGAVVYAGARQEDGSYTCRMLVAKSKLMHDTIPRNELSALLLLTELMFVAKRAIGTRVQELLYLTDSAVALAWCQSSRKRLRLFVNNRVEAIHRMIDWTMDLGPGQKPPLYHVAGADNIADMLTKSHDIGPDHVTIGSVWEAGYDWMTKPVECMPIRKYDEFKIPLDREEEIKKESYEDPFLIAAGLDLNKDQEQNDLQPRSVFMTSIDKQDRDRQLLLDPVVYGWARALRIIGLVLSFVDKLKHRIAAKAGKTCLCRMCSADTDIISEHGFYMEQAELYMYRRESVVIDRISSEKDKKTWKYDNQIYYYKTRLSEDKPFIVKDLERELPFFDSTDIHGVLPLVLPDSPLLHAYVLYVHLHVRPHAGVELSMREIMNRMIPTTGLRFIVKKVRKDCTHCKRMLLKTIELELGRHTAPRTILAPPFYNSMLDVAMGFSAVSYKNARKPFKCYALVIVCLLTSATSILCIEGLETQDVCAAIERHSARYGVPACLFVDSGTQLMALKKAEFSVKDFQTMLVRKLDVEVKVSTAKCHTQQGRVEAKIKIIRYTLDQLGVSAKSPLTTLGWETLFAKIASTIDDTPLCRSNNTNARDVGFEIITANRIKMGRNNFRSMQGGGIDLNMSANLTNLLTRNQQIYDIWYQMYVDSIHLFALRPSLWPHTDKLPDVGDVVIFVHKEDELAGRKGAEWKLARITQVEERRIELEYSTGAKKSGAITKRRVWRNPRDVAIIMTPEELAINSKDYFSRLMEPPND